jgi:hypothetical protein
VRQMLRQVWGMCGKIICTKAILLIIRVYIIWINLRNERTCYLIYWIALVVNEMYLKILFPLKLYTVPFCCKECHLPKPKLRKTCYRTLQPSQSPVLRPSWWLEGADVWILVSGCTSQCYRMPSLPSRSENNCNINLYSYIVIWRH